MRRNSFTHPEIVLCTYAALYDLTEIGGIPAIQRLTGRSPSSIQMKIQNIAAMADEEGIARNPRISALIGTTTGQPARRTNWEDVQPLSRRSRADLRASCQNILARSTGDR